ncbi:flavin reductase family protein [Streptomyces sp. CAU 1734]|uniref:flavin reductase family protein n=1 Tax=Streptomyces sp. CAU 1734 TaxID=3140360 RepID=UPI003260C5C8
MSAPARSPRTERADRTEHTARTERTARSPRAEPPARGPEAEAYLAAARLWTTGVGVLTARHGEDLFAKTVSSLCTLSLEPLLISVSVTARSPIVAAARGSARFAVSVLGTHQEPLARRFAAPGAGHALGFFTHAPMREDTGTPVLENSLAWFDCRLHTVLPGGDHAVLVGRVTGAHSEPGEPLLYHDGGYRTLHTPTVNPLSGPPTGARA